MGIGIKVVPKGGVLWGMKNKGKIRGARAAVGSMLDAIAVLDAARAKLIPPAKALEETHSKWRIAARSSAVKRARASVPPVKP